MKTINDLVNKLNDYYGMTCRVEKVLGCYNLGDNLSTYVCFDNGDWDILSGFCILHHEVQKEIMDFIYTTDSNHWFDEQEKKYNIIIGEDVGHNWQSAYKKCQFGAKVNDAVREEDLLLDDYQFTESEIKELKSGLPENMVKIVDLGKVEVKDD
ncbi:hypothetical protein [Apilactobacillus kunkeei]|uniref:hypothetical protein n=1 Tax=Apilactobacillus kunkeei TaxID=148814 RepID=UPI00200AFD65|nr:hypothetical protein [Apilactobacillus kunkeei]MCK8626629.1 hypothetical protein [Apilactobacillus kunkeei]